MTDLQTCAIVKFYPADKHQFQVDQVDTRDSRTKTSCCYIFIVDFQQLFTQRVILHPSSIHPIQKKQILVQILFYHPAVPAKIIQGTTKFSRIRVILLELSDEWFNTAWSEHGDLRTPM